MGASDFEFVGGHELLMVEGKLVLVMMFVVVFGMESALSVGEIRLWALLVSVDDRTVAIVVDELVAECRVVIQALGARLGSVRAFSGATRLASGALALIVNVVHLVRRVFVKVHEGTIAAAMLAPQANKYRVLVVDDSLTVRSLEKSILEAVGYDVQIAVDGADAWEMLGQSDFDANLIVSDVEMPRMDGFALTAAVRGSARHGELPVILVTGRGEEADQKRGIEAGANAYIVKSTFDQSELLATIAQLL
ncbi:response regulator [Endomicrobium sp. AH-315-J14]|nr:response regulator [Endomicrobium sp. AH-315-J14]